MPGMDRETTAGEVQVAPRCQHFTTGVVLSFPLSKIRFKAHSVYVGTHVPWPSCNFCMWAN